MKIFLGVWLHSKKSFRKYFHVFVCVLENALENTFSTISHIFLNFQTNIIIKIPIYKPKEKKNENLNSTNPTLDCDRERDLREKIEG